MRNQKSLPEIAHFTVEFVQELADSHSEFALKQLQKKISLEDYNSVAVSLADDSNPILLEHLTLAGLAQLPPGGKQNQWQREIDRCA